MASGNMIEGKGKTLKVAEHRMEAGLLGTDFLC